MEVFPGEGWKFQGWRNPDGTEYSPEPVLTLTVTGDLEITAVFVPEDYMAEEDYLGYCQDDGFNDVSIEETDQGLRMPQLDQNRNSIIIL